MSKMSFVDGPVTINDRMLYTACDLRTRPDLHYVLTKMYLRYAGCSEETINELLTIYVVHEAIENNLSPQELAKILEPVELPDNFEFYTSKRINFHDLHNRRNPANNG